MHRPAKSSTYLLALLPVLLLVVGVGTFAYLVLKPAELNPGGDETPPRLVRVLEAKKGTHRMAISAYGTSRASRQWTAIAEVQGRAIQVNDRFEPGEILPAGMLLVCIDPTDYQLAVDQLEAQIRSQELQFKELDRDQENLEQIRELQQQQLDLATEERQRLQSLVRDKAASDSALDAAQSAVVSYTTALQETQNKLGLIPVQRELLEASLKVLRVQLEQGERELEKCQIRLPFAARCASKTIEVDQFVAAGERLGSFLAMDKAEVVTMVEARKMRALFPRGIPELGTLDLTQMNLDESVFDRLQVPADVSWGPWAEPTVWHGRVVRLASALDQATRTIPVIVEVPNPYKDVKPGFRPPLIPDLFCHVTLFGATVEDVVVIPRDCLRQLPRDLFSDSHTHDEASNQPLEAVYLLRGGKLEKVARDGKPVQQVRGGKLHIQRVRVLAEEEDLAVIEQGVEDGDLVILTDLFPASEGMPLDGLIDQGVAEKSATEEPVPQPVDSRQQAVYRACPACPLGPALCRLSLRQRRDRE